MIRLLTLNLQHGRPVAGTHARETANVAQPGEPTPWGRAPTGPSHALLAAAEQVAAARPDVVLLQEVDRGQRRSGGIDQTAFLAGALGLRHHRFAPSLLGSATGLRLTAPGLLPVRWRAGRAGYGVAILSRHPVRSWHVLRLRGGGLRRHPAGTLAYDAGRVALAAVVDTPDGPLTVLTTHLSVEPTTARTQLARAAGALSTLPGPRVLGGDLNLDPADVAAVTGLGPLATAPTFTNRRPRRQLDHLLGDGVRAAGPGRPYHLPVSDHAGLGADVVLG
ncbi:endonuclease/exonuclease/phosphatase family protein [Georgenia sp. M64]|uniref:endonuclease/exonuclease/phosphatase family protein n=1 Tax=Georgenia sp. M64 TaxID=3120520 RepID=UPI0030E47E3B